MAVPTPPKKKRSRSEGSASATSLVAKRSRKDTKKVKGDEVFKEVSQAHRDLLDIGYPLSECIAKHNVMYYVDEMRTTSQRSKIHVPITDDFFMTIQNVVMTVELHRQLTPLENHQSLRASSSAVLLSKPMSMPSIFTSPLAVFDTSGAVNTFDDLLDGDEDNNSDLMDVVPHTSRASPTTIDSKYDNRAYYIPLNELTLYWRHYGAQHNNKRFTAVILRNYELNAASLVFGSGNIVCTGCDRPEFALWLLQSTIDKLRSAGFTNFEEPEPYLRNIVSSGRFPNTLCTSLLAVLYSDCCLRAEKFPGTMIFHPGTGKRVMLAFDSGKMCHSGAHTIEEIMHDMKLIYPMLVRCQYTVQNQKDDEECSRILNLDRNSTRRTEAIDEMKQRIESAQEQRKVELHEKRQHSAKKRAAKLRERKHALSSIDS